MEFDELNLLHVAEVWCGQNLIPVFTRVVEHAVSQVDGLWVVALLDHLSQRVCGDIKELFRFYKNAVVVDSTNLLIEPSSFCPSAL